MSFLSKYVDNKLAAYQRELIDIHYREVDTMYRKMRGWRHDYRSHIGTMKALLKSGALDELERYLDMLEKKAAEEIQTCDEQVPHVLEHGATSFLWL